MLSTNLLQKLTKNFYTTFILLFVAAVLISKFLIVVGAGERVVVFNSFSGVEEKARGEGMHLLIPFIQTPITYDVKTHTYNMSSNLQTTQRFGDSSIEALTSDGQKVKLDLSVIYNIIPAKVAHLHQEIGRDYLRKVIKPQVSSIVRGTVATYPVMDLYSEKRLIVQKDIQNEVKEALKQYYINAPEVLIRKVVFSDEFAKAVEQKQVALQEAERMKYVLQKEESEKERKIIEAQGEARAIREKGQALKANPLLIKYEYVQKITPGIKTIVTDQNTIMNFSDTLFKN